MPQFDKNGNVIQPTYATGAGNPASGGSGSTSAGMVAYGATPSQVGYQPGMSTPTLPTNSTQAVSQAQQAVQGLTSAAPNGTTTTTGGGGAGSSYSLDSTGHVTSTVTPNLLPQQADLQAKQTQLEGQIAADAAKAGAGYGSAASAQTAAQNQSAATAQEGLGEKAFSSQLAALGPLLGSSSTVGTAGSGSSIPGGMSPEETAARAAAFARAKEQSGLTAQGAMKGLEGAMESSGMMGSSLEAQGQGAVVGSAANGVNDFTREQLISDLNRYSGIADETYQGNITQRGQDLQQKNALLGLIGRGVQY